MVMRKIAKKPEPVLNEQHLLVALETLRAFRQQLEAQNDPRAPLPDQLAHWHTVRQHYEAVKAIANEAEGLSKYMSYEQLPAAFRASRVNARSMTLEGLGRFTLSSRTTAKVLDQEHANTFLRNNKQGEAIREMVPSATLNSIIADLIRSGVEPEPERDGIQANTYAYTSFTKD
jgi:hypothetical protein